MDIIIRIERNELKTKIKNKFNAYYKLKKLITVSVLQIIYCICKCEILTLYLWRENINIHNVLFICLRNLKRAIYYF